MALPKRKTSRARRDARRATHSIEAGTFGECPQCHSPRIPHRVCPVCGTYRGRQILKIKE